CDGIVAEESIGLGTMSLPRSSALKNRLISVTVLKACGGSSSCGRRRRFLVGGARVVSSLRGKGFCSGTCPGGRCLGGPVGWFPGTGLALARTEVRPESQTGPFRSHWHDEVATTGLRVDERAQVRSRIEDQYCR